MTAKFNVIYSNDGPRTPSGSTPNQTVAGLFNVGVYIDAVPLASQTPSAADKYARSVITSNGENIGNAQLSKNPLPPGLTS